MSGRLIYLALLMSVAGHSLGQNITKLNINKDHLNKRLHGYVLELHTNLSLHQCVKECMLTLGCKSFNSQTSTTTCELNWVTVSDVGTGFLVVNNSWNYFDIDAWPREMVAMCYASMCPPTHRCVTGEPVPYCRPYPKPECIDYLTAASGYIMNRNFPNGFPPTNCSWQITVSDGCTVEIDFVNNSLGPPSGCDRNYVTVYDGHNRTDPVLGTVCGNSTGAPVFSSSSNKLLVTMITDEVSLEESGFRAFYQMEYDYFTNLNSGTLVYDLPDRVPGGVVKWHIRVSEGFRVLLHIETMDVTNCQGSVVYDGMLTELTRFCGVPDLVYGSGTVMLIKIPTESSVFSASYYAGIDQTFVDIQAGVTINRMVGTMKSPNYPLDYENYIDIGWHLAFQSNYNIMFHLVDVNVEIVTDCRYDNITVVASGNVDRLFCAMPTPSFFISSGNTASVYFKTDHSSVHRGFRLDYIAVLP